MTHGKQNEATCNIKWKNETDTWNEQRRWRRRKIRRRRNRTTNDRLCMRGVWPLFAHTANLKTSKRVRICVQRTHASTKSQRRCSGKIWRSKWANLKSVLSENLDEKNKNSIQYKKYVCKKYNSGHRHEYLCEYAQSMQWLHRTHFRLIHAAFGIPMEEEFRCIYIEHQNLLIWKSNNILRGFVISFFFSL